MLQGLVSFFAIYLSVLSCVEAANPLGEAPFSTLLDEVKNELKDIFDGILARSNLLPENRCVQKILGVAEFLKKAKSEFPAWTKDDKFFQDAARKMIEAGQNSLDESSGMASKEQISQLGTDLFSAASERVTQENLGKFLAAAGPVIIKKSLAVIISDHYRNFVINSSNEQTLHLLESVVSNTPQDQIPGLAQTVVTGAPGMIMAMGMDAVKDALKEHILKKLSTQGIIDYVVELKQTNAGDAAKIITEIVSYIWEALKTLIIRNIKIDDIQNSIKDIQSSMKDYGDKTCKVVKNGTVAIVNLGTSVYNKVTGNGGKPLDTKVIPSETDGKNNPEAVTTNPQQSTLGSWWNKVSTLGQEK